MSKKLDGLNRADSFCGSVTTMAPEIVGNGKVKASEAVYKAGGADLSYTYSADFWSFGILLWEVVAAGKRIYLMAKIKAELTNRQAKGLSEESHEFDGGWTCLQLKKIGDNRIRQMFDETIPDSQRKSPDAELLKTVVCGLLKVNPDKRMTMADVRKVLTSPPADSAKY